VALPAGVAPIDSGNMEEEATFSHTFTVKGTYKYVCTLQEAMGMVGTVDVA
jgi:plastocyanin